MGRELSCYVVVIEGPLVGVRLEWWREPRKRFVEEVEVRWSVGRVDTSLEAAGGEGGGGGLGGLWRVPHSLGNP